MTTARITRPLALLTVLAVLPILALACGDADDGPAADATVAPGGPNEPSSEELAAIVDATARFTDVGAALDAGYEPASPCVAEEGLGTMGVHFVHAELVADPDVDPLRPEVLLYLPVGDDMQLVGVEWLVVDADGDVTTDDDRPVLFGRGFDGPMDGHGPGEPVHYDLHAWVHEDNPAGLLAPFNPAIGC